MKKRWIALLIFVAAGLWYAMLEPLPESHDQPYLTVPSAAAPAADNALRQRIILFGDAGESSPDPLQASLALATELAAKQPNKTRVLALGDNIYYRGFPVLEEGESEYDEDQMEDIGHLRAQLEVAKRSGATLTLVPGNHDWYAGQTDDQRHYIEAFAGSYSINASLRPKAVLPEIEHTPGASLVYIDSQAMITGGKAQLDKAMTHLATLLNTVPADNILILAAHHPTETMGPHARFYTSRVYKTVIDGLALFWENDQDTDTPTYARYIAALNRVLADFPGRAVYAAGHDHNLQVFGGKNQPPPQYRLVSGAANTSKVTGVGDNDNTLFAVAREGFMSIDVHEDGSFLSVWTIDSKEPIFRYRLW